MLYLVLLLAQFSPPPGAGPGGLRTVSLYYSPAAKNMGGVGASAFQCASSCPTPSAISTGTSATASLLFSGSAMTIQDQFVLPAGYANSAITIEAIWRTADSNTGHSGILTVTSGQLGAAGDITNPTFANSTAITLTPISTASGRIVSTATFTPSWTGGNTIYWKGAMNVGTITSDVELISFRLVATY